MYDMGNIIENGKIIFGYMAMMLEERTPWDSQTVYHQNRCKMDEHGNWWVSKKSTQDAPNINHPFPGFDANNQPIASEWWALWIDWQHPMAQLSAAMSQAIAAAESAEQQAAAARSAAEQASQVDVVELTGRVSSLENALQSLSEGDIANMQQAITSLQALIGADVDGNINKFNEIIRFLAGIGDTSTLEGLFQDVASQLAQKQPAGDYATNERVDELEAKVGRYCSPRFESDVLVFPAENDAHFENDVLVLTI